MKLLTIENAKKEALEQYQDGLITAKEYHEQIERAADKIYEVGRRSKNKS